MCFISLLKHVIPGPARHVWFFVLGTFERYWLHLDSIYKNMRVP